MKKTILRLLAGALFLACVAALPAAAQVRFFVKFKSSFDQYPESIAIDKKGNIYVSHLDQKGGVAEVVKVTRRGKASVLATLPQGNMLGVATDSKGNVYALLNAKDPADKGLWRVTPNGKTKLLASFPAASMINALAFDRRGNLYITDSYKSDIYRVAPDGSSSVWLHDPAALGGVKTSACGTFPAGALGANGIALYKGSFYVLNTSRGMVARIPLERDGKPGKPEVFAKPTCELWGADGQAFDNRGNLYVAVNIQNKIAKIDPAGHVSIVAAKSAAVPLYTPTAIAFGTTRKTRRIMFIADSTIFIPGAQAGVVTLKAGARGQPLP
ncbi:MAG TPA: SMP-30/gluconolactonase/LRE family protein [Patescibacteria group bacterium]|nr:SMP-30/gluconolactonase/LRE family protein [Patescibacteria group bacterium]